MMIEQESDYAGGWHVLHLKARGRVRALLKNVSRVFYTLIVNYLYLHSF